MEYIIGFSNKYYTLWSYSEETITKYGETILKANFNYIKNISFDINKVKTLYPNVKIDIAIKGNNSFSRILDKKHIEYPNNVFKFGRYIGLPIKECKDIEYIKWYWIETKDAATKEYFKEALDNTNYSFYEDEILNNDEIEKINAKLDKISKLEIKLKNNEAFEVSPKHNLVYGDGDNIAYYIEDIFTLKFKNFKVLYYNGFAYALPTINDKAKRIKNNKISITKYTYTREDGYLDIIVDEFKIIK